jgi:hypothetical protein
MWPVWAGRFTLNPVAAQSSSGAARRLKEGQPRLPRRVRREDVIFCLHHCMAGEPAFGVVFLYRCIGRERGGRWVIIKLSPSPIAGAREPLAIPHHAAKA